MLAAECTVVEEIAREFQRLGYRHLGRLLAVTPTRGQPLLAMAVQYYFRRAVGEDPVLARELTWVKLIAIDRRVQEGFAFLALIQERHGQTLEEALDGLARVEVVVVETRDAVLNLHEDVRGLTEQFKLMRRDLTSGHSLSYRDEQERELIEAVKRRYRALSDDQRRRFPQLGLDLSQLEIVAGDYKEALGDAREAARHLDEPAPKAKAHHAGYRAALELKSWDEALAELRQAAEADQRYAIWPATKYQIERILGAGAFGVAFLCRDTYLDRLVVIKTFEAAGLDRDVATLFREARILDGLRNPGIIHLYGCGFVDEVRKERPYLEIAHFADSLTLEDHVHQHGPLTLDDLQAVAVQTAEALQAAHAAGVWHRDVKPANLLVRKTARGWEVKVIDFGLSLRRSLVQTSQARAAGQGRSMIGSTIAGTLHYAAPEQLDPNRTTGDRAALRRLRLRADLLLHACSASRIPTRRTSIPCPPPWKDFLGRCTAKKIDRRPKDFAAVLALLAAIREPIVEVRPPPPPPPPPEPEPQPEVPSSGWVGSKPGDLKVVRVKDVEVRFRWCPPTARPFKMGSPKNEEGRYSNEDQVDVTLTRGFWMQETEVTQGLWRAVMGSKLDWSSKGDAPELPAYNVSHTEAEEFGAKLTHVLQQANQLPSGLIITLPTEAQWEYAARAGSTTRFPFGDQDSKLGDYAWYNGNAGGKPHAVKTRKPNAWDLYDMLGNVWEWCADGYADKLPGGPDPRGPSGASSRVFRGGCWSYVPGAAARRAVAGSSRSHRYCHLGFRLAAVQE